jgi:hypothetical protein
LAGTEPATITDLWLRAKKVDPRTSHSTVWRLLKALVECGLLAYPACSLILASRRVAPRISDGDSESTHYSTLDAALVATFRRVLPAPLAVAKNR